MQEQSTTWMVLSIENTLKHGAFTDSWVGQQEQVTWTHLLIFFELCMPEKLPEFKCNLEAETDLPPQGRTSVMTKMIKAEECTMAAKSEKSKTAETTSG
jgi:hypothetical protein